MQRRHDGHSNAEGILTQSNKYSERDKIAAAAEAKPERSERPAGRASDATGTLSGGNPLAGAPPCNTAPANCIEPKNTRILRCGIDSLYVSFPGNLDEPTIEKLSYLKALAQSDDRAQQAQAQISLARHLFEVKDRGYRRFLFGLVDNWFRIYLPGSPQSILPMAYCQISSEALTLEGAETVMAQLIEVMQPLGWDEQHEARISRVDLCVDFTTSVPLDAFAVGDWVTRARNISQHSVGKRFSGWSIGMGGAMGARLYDKTLEIQKSGKDYFFPLWKAAGWNGVDPVWRLEFEFKRDALEQFKFNHEASQEVGIRTFPVLMVNLSKLWRYACEDWLRLTIPNPSDNTQTRWPTHPLWDFLTNAGCWDVTDGMRLVRARMERIPQDRTLFVNGLAPITSFMAREGILDIDEGAGAYLHCLKAHHEPPGKAGDLQRYVEKKVREKGRRYNTIDNRENQGEDDEQ